MPVLLHIDETIFFLVTPELLTEVIGESESIFNPQSLKWKLYLSCTICTHGLFEHASSRGVMVTEPGEIAACRCCALTTAVPVRIEQRRAWLSEV